MKTLRYFNLSLICIVLSILTACSDNISDDADSLTSQFTLDKLAYQVNEEIMLTNTTQGGSGNYIYEWDFGDGRTSTEKDPVITYPELGAYKITLNVHDSNGRFAMSHKLVSVEPEPLPEVGNMTVKWVANQPLGTIRGIVPAVSEDNYVYMTSEDHKLRKFDSSTGTQVWEFDLRSSADGPAPEGNTHVSPSIDTDGTIFVGTGNTSGKIARLYAVNPDGTKKWCASSDANTGFWNKGKASTPRLHYIICPIDDKCVYAGNAGSTGSVLGFDKQTGARTGYAASSLNDGGPNGGATGGLVLSGNTVSWYGAKNGVFGCNASDLQKGTNAMYWLCNNGKTSDTGNGALAVGYDGTIYGAARMTQGSPTGSAVFAIDASGNEKWRCSIGSTGNLDMGGPVIAEDGSIIVTAKRTAGESNGGVYCVSSTGELLWSYLIPEDVSGCAAIDQAGNIHFGTEAGNYYIIKPTLGDDQLVLKKDIAGMIAESNSSMAGNWSAGGAKIWSSPVIAKDGTVYIGVTNQNNGNLSALVALRDEGITGPANSAWPMKGRDQRHTSRMEGNSGPDGPGDIGSNSQLPLTWDMRADMKALIANPTKVWICSHRGITKKSLDNGIPENSIAALDLAIKAGAEMVEIDVRPTKDGKLVLMHDETVDRTTNGTGKVTDLTLAQIQSLSLLNPNTGNASGSKIPTLEEYMKHAKGKIYLNLDIAGKLTPEDPANPLYTLGTLIKELGMENQCVVYMGTKMSYVNAMSNFSGILFHPYVGENDGTDTYGALDSVLLMQISTNDAQNNTRVTAQVRNAGCLVYSNSLNGPDNNMTMGNYSAIDAFLSNNVSIIQTNYTELLGAYLTKKGLR